MFHTPVCFTRTVLSVGYSCARKFQPKFPTPSNNQFVVKVKGVELTAESKSKMHDLFNNVRLTIRFHRTDVFLESVFETFCEDEENEYSFFF